MAATSFSAVAFYDELYRNVIVRVVYKRTLCSVAAAGTHDWVRWKFCLFSYYVHVCICVSTADDMQDKNLKRIVVSCAR